MFVCVPVVEHGPEIFILKKRHTVVNKIGEYIWEDCKFKHGGILNFVQIRRVAKKFRFLEGLWRLWPLFFMTRLCNMEVFFNSGKWQIIHIEDIAMARKNDTRHNDCRLRRNAKILQN